MNKPQGEGETVAELFGMMAPTPEAKPGQDAPVPAKKPAQAPEPTIPKKAPPAPVEKPERPTASSPKPSIPTGPTDEKKAPGVDPIGPATDVGYAPGMGRGKALGMPDGADTPAQAQDRQQIRSTISKYARKPIMAQPGQEEPAPDQEAGGGMMDWPIDVQAMMEYSQRRKAPAFKYRGQIYVANATSPGGYEPIGDMELD